MAWDHRLSNAGEGALSWGSAGASIGQFAGTKGALIGGGIGAALGLLKGLFSDTEMQELADRYARGDIDPETANNIQRLVADRFRQIRSDQGARFSRAGIEESTFAERMRADTDMDERDALTQAMLDQVERNRMLGLDMKRQQGQETDATVGRSIDNIMGVMSGFAADKRWDQRMALFQEHSDAMKALATDGGAGEKMSPVEAKAYAAVGTYPGLGTFRGAQRGASGNLTTKWQNLKGGKSVTQRRTGGGSYSARNSNPHTSGAWQRSNSRWGG